MSGVAKSPAVWGAFPLDPYSHSPAQGGARQPGMTGQVKEEILIRLNELGVRVRAGRVTFAPRLVRRAELLAAPARVAYQAVDGRRLQLELPADSLAFTCWQVPIVYRLSPARRIVITLADGRQDELAGDTLDADRSASLFRRDGRIARVEVELEPGRP